MFDYICGIKTITMSFTAKNKKIKKHASDASTFGTTITKMVKKDKPKEKTMKGPGSGGARDGSGASQLVPNKVRKTIDLPEEVCTMITESGSDISSYLRKAAYNQLVKEKKLSRERANELINWKKK